MSWTYRAGERFAAADRLLEEINDTLQALAAQHEMGRGRPELGPGVRSFPSGSFVVFYRGVPGGMKVVRVPYGRGDVEGQFQFPEGDRPAAGTPASGKPRVHACHERRAPFSTRRGA